MTDTLQALRRETRREALAIGTAFAALLVFFVAIDAFEFILKMKELHEEWELDEILTTLMVLPVGIAIFAFRRYRQVELNLSQRVHAERKIEAMAFYDPLTGMPNRRRVESRLEKWIAIAEERPFALAVMDLDRFKSVNDLYGHRVGDELLQVVADRISAELRPGDIAGRVGGDEFLVLFGDIGCENELIERLDSMRKTIAEPCTLDRTGARVSVGASLGVTHITSSATTVDEVISQADAAMYRCKQSGDREPWFFEKGMEDAARKLAERERDLGAAILHDRIEPHFQPLIDLSTRRIIGYEVLARWRGVNGEIFLPDEFIPIAERSGQINQIYYAMLRRAVQTAAGWAPHIALSVNISPLQFGDPLLVDRTIDILTEAGVACDRLEVEVTESALFADIDAARRVIEAFKQRGVRTALDDFGIGYSSLRHLKELPFDRLKIDKSFVAGLGNQHKNKAIVRAVTLMAHQLGLSVTAEGIEDAETLALLRDFGCDVGQGYLFGRPEPQSAPLCEAPATADTLVPLLARAG